MPTPSLLIFNANKITFAAKNHNEAQIHPKSLAWIHKHPTSKKSMTKKNKIDEQENYANIIKAVAQAWHGHSTTPMIEDTSEFDARRLYFLPKPSRFRIEAGKREEVGPSVRKWDFAKSLWDSYEIVNVSKKLDRCLVDMDDPFSESNRVRRPVRVKRHKESKNSLRNLFKISSRRFSEVDFSS